MSPDNPAVLSGPKKLRTRSGYGYLVGWRDRWRGLDEAKHPAMMLFNVEPRPRNYAFLMRSMLTDAGVETEGGKWQRGERSFVQHPPAHSAPGAVPDLWQRNEAPADAYLYLSGPDGFANTRFRSPGAAVEGILVLEMRVALTFPPGATLKRQLKFAEAMWGDLSKVSADLRCRAVLRDSTDRTVATVIVLRLLSRTFPASPDGNTRAHTNRYMSKLRSIPRS